MGRSVAEEAGATASSVMVRPVRVAGTGSPVPSVHATPVSAQPAVGAASVTATRSTGDRSTWVEPASAPEVPSPVGVRLSCQPAQGEPATELVALMAKAGMEGGAADP